MTERHIYIHEAGHAVVAHALGFEVVAIEPTDTGFKTAFEAPEAPTLLEHYLTAVITLAGAAAQQKAGVAPDPGCDTDRNQAIASILLYLGEDPQAWVSCLTSDYMPEQFEPAYIRAGELAVDLVKARWSSIQTLAAALEEFQSLSMDEIKDILEPEEE